MATGADTGKVLTSDSAGGTAYWRTPMSEERLFGLGENNCKGGAGCRSERHTADALCRERGYSYVSYWTHHSSDVGWNAYYVGNGGWAYNDDGAGGTKYYIAQLYCVR